MCYKNRLGQTWIPTDKYFSVKTSDTGARKTPLDRKVSILKINK